MPARAGQRRILVVEDERIVADTLGQILAVNGYEIRVVYSAEEAISLLQHWCPDMAILDVMLPKMNGIELAMILKQNRAGCHVLLVSGQPAVEMLVEKAKMEGHDFEILAKPVHPSVVLNAVSSRLCHTE
jgi:DNA-binding NtrC family response regulator